MASGGLAFLLISMVSSVLLITDYMLNIWAAIILTTIAGGWFLTLWAVVPWFRRNWIDEADEVRDEASSGTDVEAGEEINPGDGRSTAVRGL
jgi:hypothetical protein